MVDQQGFIFCENSKKRNLLLNSIEKYINLKKLNVKLISLRLMEEIKVRF